MEVFNEMTCEGYTQEEMNTLNSEFNERFESGEYQGWTEYEAAKYFSDEVSRR